MAFVLQVLYRLYNVISSFYFDDKFLIKEDSVSYKIQYTNVCTFTQYMDNIWVMYTYTNIRVCVCDLVKK